VGFVRRSLQSARPIVELRTSLPTAILQGCISFVLHWPLIWSTLDACFSGISVRWAQCPEIGMDHAGDGVAQLAIAIGCSWAERIDGACRRLLLDLHCLPLAWGSCCFKHHKTDNDGMFWLHLGCSNHVLCLCRPPGSPLGALNASQAPDASGLSTLDAESGWCHWSHPD
jgi:hypothetical protein